MTWLGKTIQCFETGQQFDSLKELLKEFPYSKYAPQVANGKRSSAGGYRWGWVNFEKDSKKVFKIGEIPV